MIQQAAHPDPDTHATPAELELVWMRLAMQAMKADAAARPAGNARQAQPDTASTVATIHA